MRGLLACLIGISAGLISRTRANQTLSNKHINKVFFHFFVYLLMKNCPAFNVWPNQARLGGQVLGVPRRNSIFEYNINDDAYVFSSATWMSMSSSRKMRRRLSVSSSESRVDRFRNMHGCTKQYYYNNNDKKKDERYTVVSQIYCPLVSLLSSYLHSHFLPKRIISESQIKISVLRA